MPVPIVVFDALAPLWAGRDVKRANLKVRSWVTALVRCSLVVGSLAHGVYQHDIVRHFVITRHSEDELRALHTKEVDERELEELDAERAPALGDLVRADREAPRRLRADGGRPQRALEAGKASQHAGIRGQSPEKPRQP